MQPLLSPTALRDTRSAAAGQEAPQQLPGHLSLNLAFHENRYLAGPRHRNSRIVNIVQSAGIAEIVLRKDNVLMMFTQQADEYAEAAHRYINTVGSAAAQAFADAGIMPLHQTQVAKPHSSKLTYDLTLH